VTPLRYAVDASVAIKLVVEEPGSDDAHSFFSRVADGPGGGLYVPDLFYAECANVLWKQVKRLKLSQREAEQNLERIRKLAVTELHTRDLLGRVIQLAVQHDVSAYDATYVATAEQAHVPLVTADAPLVEKFRGKQPLVLSLADAVAQTTPGAGGQQGRKP
jgi:predicted nucleic acid-binding protein